MKFNIRLILAVLASWFIPGLGYWVIGKKYKALLLLSSIIFVITAGILLADSRDIRFIDNPYYYVGRFGSGLVWCVTIVFLHPAPLAIVPFQYFDIGHLYLCVAGVLNLVIALSVFSQHYSSADSSAGNIIKTNTDKEAEPTLI